MKRVIMIVAVLLLALEVTACGANKASNDGASGVVERDESGVISSSVSEFDENSEAVATPEVEAEATALSLPLVIENHTVAGDYAIFEDDEEVRSVYSNGETHFLIKEDNTLWAWGDNSEGQVGDGTGVNREEMVKILDDVANLYFTRENIFYREQTIFAVKLDKTLWGWGEYGGVDGEKAYAPVQLADDVIKYFGQDLIQKQDGSIWRLSHGKDSGMYQVAKNIMDYSEKMYMYSPGDGSTFISGEVNSEGILSINETDMIDVEVNGRRVVPNTAVAPQKTNILTVADVKSVKIVRSPWGPPCYIVKTDDTLWAWGVNSEGQLGDGTKIDRDEPVKILDNVSAVYVRGSDNSNQFLPVFVLKKDGSVWWWDSSNPTPRKILDDIVQCVIEEREGLAVAGKVFALKSDGSLWEWDGSKAVEIATGVRLPSTTIVE